MMVTVELTQILCGSCGGTYAISERYRKNQQEHAGEWHCPYCKIGWGYLKSAVTIEREHHQKTLDRLNEATAEKERLERKLKRVDRGMCPQCNRPFQQLARHMACKHAPKDRHDR